MNTNYDYDYITAGMITQDRRYGFFPCLIAAFKQADTENLAKLKTAFPEVYEAIQINQKTELMVKFEDWQEEKKYTRRRFAGE